MREPTLVSVEVPRWAVEFCGFGWGMAVGAFTGFAFGYAAGAAEGCWCQPYWGGYGSAYGSGWNYSHVNLLG